MWLFALKSLPIPTGPERLQYLCELHQMTTCFIFCTKYLSVAKTNITDYQIAGSCKGVGRKIFRGEGNEKKTKKYQKRLKIALISIHLLYLYYV